MAGLPGDDQNLTGIWNGLYTYQDGASNSFVATLIDSNGSLSGTTHEQSDRFAGLRVTLCANLVGSRDGKVVTFTKTYDTGTPYHKSPIRYAGMLNGDGSEIEGRWTIVGSCSGKFLMIRSANEAVAASHKAFERA